MKILIKSGIVVTQYESRQADILVHNGLVSQIGDQLTGVAGIEEIIDASGKYIFPGGVDPHVHMHLPTPAGYSSDDFLSGSRAALAGGTTTMIDFVTPRRGQSLIEALEQRIAESSAALTNCYFHVSPVEWRSSTRLEIFDCVRRGIRSFKIYLAYKNTVGISDETIMKVMKAVSEAGAIVIAHCEMGDEIEEMRNEFAQEGLTSPFYHPLSRPPYTESNAVKSAIDMATQTGCPLYIVHVSSLESLSYIREAQQKGLPVYAETCPQYLLLDDSKYEGTFEQTAPFVLSPPLRKQSDQQALWSALADGTIQTVGTDHCPFMLSQKALGEDDFRKIPNGVGGVEHRLALLYTYGVLQKRITLNQFVKLTSTNAAEIFGLSPSKGTIAIGADADLVVWNPHAADIISSKTHHQHCDTNVFEGITTHGRPDYVLKGGNIIRNSPGFQQ